MDVFIDACGFVGAWLLFAGPIWQASLELGEYEIDREDFEQYTDQVPEEPPVSPWWWLLPPVAYLRIRARSSRRRDAIMAAMPQEKQELAFTFFNASTGWMLVGIGAFFIAVKESYELSEALHWPLWSLVPLIVVPFALSVANTVRRSRRTQRLRRDTAS